MSVKKPSTLVILTLLRGLEATIKCYNEKYPSERCEKCELHFICQFLHNIDNP